MKQQELWERLRTGPVILLLGQSYLRAHTGTDWLLVEIAKKYGGDPADGYEILFGDDFQRAGVDALAWVNERARHVPVPATLEALSDFPWSAVLASAIDPVWFDALDKPWRQLQVVYEEQSRPQDPRSRTNLHATLLYGCVRWPDTFTPPLSSFEYRRRTQVAVALLRRLKQVLTPRGTLLIEGYSRDDWLSPEDLFPTLSELAPGQVHLFTSDSELRRHEDVLHLTGTGVVAVHEGSAASMLTAGVQAGAISSAPATDVPGSRHRITLRDQYLDVPPDLWHRASRSAVVLDDAAVERPPALTPASRYYAFRQFLSRSEGVPDWSAYARSFPFPREFEDDLFDAVRTQLVAKHLQERPILVHGQTGSGKTVALARLAYRVRTETGHPTLFIPRRLQPPNPADIEAFVRWAENSGAGTVLIVWDAMGSGDDYSELMAFLGSRGRKTVVVGSAYHLDSPPTGRSFEAPAALTQGEAGRFPAHLASIDASFANRIPPSLTMDAFLVTLYWLLPPSRGQLRSGVTREVGSAEAKIASRDMARPVSIAPINAMQEALFRVGLVNADRLSEQSVEIGGETMAGTERLTGVVMVPGQFGLKTPLELLLRTLERPGYERFVDLLDGTDVFQWYEDTNGNVDVGPRNSLEAQIVVQSRLGSAATEVGFVTLLINNLVSESALGFGGREVQFIAALVQAMSRRDTAPRYRSFYADIADALTEARAERGVEHPQLLLQEAHLLREWVRVTEGSVDAVQLFNSLSALLGCV